MTTANRPHRLADYELFCQGVDAFRLGHPRRAPPALTSTGPDSEQALWLNGYDMERDEYRALRKHNLEPEYHATKWDD